MQSDAPPHLPPKKSIDNDEEEPRTNVVDPTWEQVDEFSDGYESNDWTEEIEYLTFDFGGTPPSNAIQSYKNFQLLGLNTDTPFLHLGSQIYQGEYERLIGTELIMKCNAEIHKNQEKAGEEKKYEALTATTQRIRWIPVKLNEKEDDDEVSSGPENDIKGTNELTNFKKKKLGGSSSGGRHWASHWKQYTPRNTSAKKNSFVLESSKNQAHSTSTSTGT